MAWHYYTENREKIGPVTNEELKRLVQQGTITPKTFVEDPRGRTGLAKDVNGLTFSEVAPTVESEIFSFSCPNCQSPLQAKKKSAGKTKKCPKCGTSFTVPPPDTPLFEDIVLDFVERDATNQVPELSPTPLPVPVLPAQTGQNNPFSSPPPKSIRDIKKEITALKSETKKTVEELATLRTTITVVSCILAIPVALFILRLIF